MSEKLWLEIRAYHGMELKRANMEPVINYAFNSGEPFEFLVSCTESPRSGMDREVVRWFVGMPDEKAAEAVKNQLEAEGFYVKAESPPDPRKAHDMAAELRMTDHFARALLPRRGEPQEDRSFDEYPDVAGNLAGALGSGGALWISFKASEGAAREAHGRAGGLEGSGGWGGALDILESFIGGALSYGGRRSGKGSKRGYGDEETTAEKRRSEAAEKIRNRARGGLFSCDIRAYGTESQIGNIVRSFPFSPNGLEVDSLERPEESGEDHAPDPEPSTRWLKRKFSKWMPVSLLGLYPLLWTLDLWNPLQTLATVRDTLIAVGIAVAVGVLSALNAESPIATAVPELILLTSLPENLESVPFEPGKEAGPSESISPKPMETEKPPPEAGET